jgi:hypothetical protein
MEIPQVELEKSYYMADIPRILEDKVLEKNKKILENIMIQLTTNNRSFDEEEYKKFMGQLVKAAGIEDNSDKFDREAMEKLRFLTNMGANKSK